MKKTKTPQDSLTEMTLIVRPTDANTLGACFGGAILEWMDMVASICARRHSNLRVNTAKVDSVVFQKPLRVGDVAHLIAKTIRAFRSSMEIHVWLYKEDTYRATRELAAQSIFILVGLDEAMKPHPVPKLEPQTDEEKRLWQEAGDRRDKTKQIS